MSVYAKKLIIQDLTLGVRTLGVRSEDTVHTGNVRFVQSFFEVALDLLLLAVQFGFSQIAFRATK